MSQLEAFKVQIGAKRYEYSKQGILTRFHTPPRQQREVATFLSEVVWKFAKNVKIYDAPDQDPSHYCTVELYRQGMLVGSVDCDPDDLSSPGRFLSAIFKGCGILPIPQDPPKVREIDLVMRSAKEVEPKRVLEVGHFGWGNEAACPGFHAPSASVIAAQICKNNALPPRSGYFIEVQAQKNRYAKLLDLTPAGDEDVGKALVSVVDDFAKFWEEGKALPLLGAAILAPYLERCWPDEMHPVIWYSGKFASGKSYAFCYAMRFFGQGWTNQQLPGISSSTASWLYNMSRFRNALAPTDDIKASFFRYQGESEAFFTQLHQYTMGRGRERADRSGKTDEAKATQIRGTLICNAQFDLEDFGASATDGAILSRVLQVKVHPVSLATRERQKKKLERTSLLFSAITLRILKFVQRDKLDLRQQSDEVAERLREFLEQKGVSIENVGRQIELCRFWITGLHLLHAFCLEHYRDLATDVEKLVDLGYFLAVTMLEPEVEETRERVDWWRFLEITNRLVSENHAQYVKPVSGNPSTEPDGNTWREPHLHVDMAHATRPVLGVSSADYLYLYPSMIRDMAKKVYKEHLSIPQVVTALCNVEVKDEMGVDHTVMLWQRRRRPLRMRPTIEVNGHKVPKCIVFQRKALEILVSEFAEAPVKEMVEPF